METKNFSISHTFHKYPNIFVITSIIILTIFIRLFVYHNGLPTCSNYIINTYLYLALAGLISALTIINNKPSKIDNTSFLLTFISIIILIFIFVFIPPKNLIASHFVWLLLILGLSFLISLFVRSHATNTIIRALLSMALVFIITSAIGFLFFDKLKKVSHILGFGLLIALISIICFEIIYRFITKSYPTKKQMTINIIVIFVFSLFIIYDTVEMKKNSLTCNIESSVHYPNYPSESFNFFLDLINIFVRSLGLSR